MPTHEKGLHASIDPDLISTCPSSPTCPNVQIIVQRHTLLIVRVDGDLGDECRRGEQLHFDAAFGNDVVGECYACAEQQEEDGEPAQHGACIEVW